MKRDSRTPQFLFSVLFPSAAAIFAMPGMSYGLARAAGGDSLFLHWAVPPAVTRVSEPSRAQPGGAAEWTAAVDCAAPVAPASLIGARVVFTLDFDLDGTPDGVQGEDDAGDTLGISPADCGAAEDGQEAGRISLRRRFTPAHPALLRASLQTPAGTTVATHAALTGGAGSLLGISRYCARPKNGEPEWIEIRNRTAFAVALAPVRLEARAFSGMTGGGSAAFLGPGEALVVGGDTAELRLWQPGARILSLSSWPNLRNSGDTMRLALAPAQAGSAANFILDSVLYGAAAHALEGCASLESEGSGAAASGYALELPAARWRPQEGPFVFRVRAPSAGRYDLRLYDVDGARLCALARHAAGSAEYSLSAQACAGLSVRGARGARGTAVILHLAPRAAPATRTMLRITE